ncbi:MAG TPA: hypothetical protein VJI46_02520, partial [Candidatus Nanoarchaeia archaeon]|nr:hypothetical protein [Candidatus Nanoarchaeia archaeon]
MSERHRSLVENLREFVNVDIANEYKRSKWGELSLREKLDKTEKMKGLVLGDLEEALEQVSRFFEQENSHGKILYRGENDSHVIDFLIPPYIIEADGKFYAFKGARLSMTFSGIT